MTTFPDVRTLTSEPEVGRYYLVPCVRGWRGWAWPIGGPLHDDAELGVATLHYHYDARFLTTSQIAHLMSDGDDLGVAHEKAALAAVHTGSPERPAWALPVALVSRRCHRKQPRFPVSLTNRAIFRPFADAYREAHPDARLVNGRCPHRGIDLRSMPEDPDGMVTCPGHGLRWCPVSGGLADRQLSDMGDESNQGRGSGRRKG